MDSLCAKRSEYMGARGTVPQRAGLPGRTKITAWGRLDQAGRVPAQGEVAIELGAGAAGGLALGACRHAARARLRLGCAAYRRSALSYLKVSANRSATNLPDRGHLEMRSAGAVRAPNSAAAQTGLRCTTS